MSNHKLFKPYRQRMLTSEKEPLSLQQLKESPEKHDGRAKRFVLGVEQGSLAFELGVANTSKS